MTDLTDRSERLLWPTYLVSAVLVLFPLVDLITAAWPLSIKAVAWRFGAVGLLSGGLVTPVLGIFLSLMVAILAERRIAVRVLSVLAALLALAVLVMMPLFTLDALQMRSRVQPAAMSRFMLASGLAMMKLAALTAVAVVMGVVGLRAAKRKPGSDRKVVLGRQGAPLGVGAVSAASSAESRAAGA